MNALFEQPLSIAGDVLFLRTAEGVEIKGSRDVLRLRGDDTYQLLERLAPHLRGTQPLGPMLEALPESKRNAVTRLCTLLHERGFLRPAGGAGAIAQYAGHFGADAAAFCDEQFFICGASPARRGICHALIELGAGRLVVEGEHDVRIEQYAAGRAEISFSAATTRDEVRVASFVLPFAHRRRWIVIGPLECGHAATVESGAMAAALQTLEAKPGWSIDVDGPLPPTTVAMLGNIIALELFRAVTGAGAVRLDRRVALINPATLELALLRLEARP
jgi:hypothetical protein